MHYIHNHLLLGIDHEWPPPTSCDQHSILRGDAVTRQTVLVPLPDLVRVGQCLDDCEIPRDGDLELATPLYPTGNQLRERGREGERERGSDSTKYIAEIHMHWLREIL